MKLPEKVFIKAEMPVEVPGTFIRRFRMAEVKKDLRKIERECQELDKLEARLRRLVSPDEKLLAQIAQRRNELLKS